MKELMGQDKDWEITYQLLSWARHTQQGKLNLLSIKMDLNGENDRQN